MAYEEDIENRGFLDWLKAHTSFMKPLHRYEGVLELDGERMRFEGRDVKEGGDFKLEAETGNITDVSLGFDDTFRRWEARVPWNDPLRIKYESEEGEKTVYLYVRFHTQYGFRTSDNEEVVEKLKTG